MAAVMADNLGGLPQLQDYSVESKAMAKDNIPLLLAVVSQDCHYCAALKADFLTPLLRNTAYAERVRIRQLVMDDGGELLAADGGSISTAEQAAAWGVAVVPTVLFLDTAGQELAERIVGLGNADYYWSFLDTAIDESLAQLGNPLRVP